MGVTDRELAQGLSCMDVKGVDNACGRALRQHGKAQRERPCGKHRIRNRAQRHRRQSPSSSVAWRARRNLHWDRRGEHRKARDGEQRGDPQQQHEGDARGTHAVVLSRLFFESSYRGVHLQHLDTEPCFSLYSLDFPARPELRSASMSDTCAFFLDDTHLHDRFGHWRRDGPLSIRSPTAALGACKISSVFR